MSGLYYKYGTMNSSKTANLLMAKHNYDEQQFKTVILKPSVDTRDGEGVIYSRIGLKANCIMLEEKTKVTGLVKDYEVVFVDEAQFLTRKQVDELYSISEEKTVLCYGLLTDFRRDLFPGSARLLELADSIAEIKSICSCGRRAVVNARFKDDKIVIKGEQVMIGAEDKYRALCRFCYDKMIKELK